MIKIRIRNDDHEIDLQFPISENKLYAKLAEIHAIEGKDAPQSAFVTEVYWPEELSMLKDRFANLDELNYLARRMESFDYHEYDQFLIGITKLENPTEKDLINLTFNLDHFTLCKDVSGYGKIGREYVMNTQGAVPANDEDDPKYAAIGKDLIDRGLAQITGKGILIYNPFDELTEVYDGQTFPEYYYENTLASAEVSYNGRTELLLLPGEELAIQKALARLGAPSDSDCEIKFCLNQGEDDAWEERIEGIIRSEGLYEANKMLRSLDTGDMNWSKLTAAVELADVKSAANIAAVAEHLGEFAFIPDAKSESDVGHFLVDNVEEYEMNIEMEEYFDFSGFGEYFAEEHDGQFVNGGFVYFDSDRSLDEFLEELESEDEGMDMGGIDRYGFDRVNWVLANTLQEKAHDGRFSQDNKRWAKGFFIPSDDVRWHFCVESHPGLTDLFINQTREAWQKLGLFDASHCSEDNDYAGKLLLLKPSVLKDEFKASDYQLFYAESGFGCSPTASGRKVFGKFLKDGENTNFNRSDFLGVIKDECIPEWAAEKLAELEPPDEDESEGITMGGM